jgi:phage terminase small subunit
MGSLSHLLGLILWGMTPRQRKFSEGYAKSQNVYQSAKDAGYSENYARTKAKILLGNAEIIGEIKRIRERLNQQADKSATDVVNEFSKIAFTDRVGFLKPDPLRDDEFMYKSPDELTQSQRDIVETTKMYTAEIVVLEDGDTKRYFRQEYIYVLSEKAKALEQMGRHFGIFDDKLRIGTSQANPFVNVTQAQLEELKKAWVTTMTDPKLLEGEFKVLKDDA